MQVSTVKQVNPEEIRQKGRAKQLCQSQKSVFDRLLDQSVRSMRLDTQELPHFEKTSLTLSSQWTICIIYAHNMHAIFLNRHHDHFEDAFHALMCKTCPSLLFKYLPSDSFGSNSRKL